MAFTSVLAPTVFTGSTPNTALFAKAPLERDICARVRVLGGLFMRTELVLGSAKPDGSAVTEEEFRRFLDQQVTPRFPEDLTLLVDLGQFRDVRGVITPERSMLLILLYPFGQAASDDNIEHIREAYKAAFQQQSVFRTDSRACVSF
jgi:Protein of unknown function (DUF3574)